MALCMYQNDPSHTEYRNFIKPDAWDLKVVATSIYSHEQTLADCE